MKCVGRRTIMNFNELRTYVYPIKGRQMLSHQIYIYSTKVDAFLGIDEHNKVQGLNPLRVTTLQDIGNNNVKNVTIYVAN